MSRESLKQDIALDELFRAVFARKGLIIIGTLFFAIISVAIALHLPNQFKSKSTLIINTQSSGGLSSLAGSLGGLAGMAGIQLGGVGEGSNPLIARELITSQTFILSFIEKQNMLVPLMAAKSWNASTGELVLNDNIYNTETNSWLVNNQFSSELRPRKEDIVRAFNEIVTLSEDSKTGVLTLSIEFYSPVLAQQWLIAFIDEINEKIRQYDIDNSTKSLTYLKQLLSETDNQYFKETFYKLIEEQTKTLMLSKVRADYVFKIIDPPNAPEKKSKPSRAIVCVIGTFLGGVLMVLFVLIRHFYKR